MVQSVKVSTQKTKQNPLDPGLRGTVRTGTHATRQLPATRSRPPTLAKSPDTPMPGEGAFQKPKTCNTRELCATGKIIPSTSNGSRSTTSSSCDGGSSSCDGAGSPKVYSWSLFGHHLRRLLHRQLGCGGRAGVVVEEATEMATEMKSVKQSVRGGVRPLCRQNLWPASDASLCLLSPQPATLSSSWYSPTVISSLPPPLSPPTSPGPSTIDHRPSSIAAAVARAAARRAEPPHCVACPPT